MKVKENETRVTGLLHDREFAKQVRKNCDQLRLAPV